MENASQATTLSLYFYHRSEFNKLFETDGLLYLSLLSFSSLCSQNNQAHIPTRHAIQVGCLSGLGSLFTGQEKNKPKNKTKN